MGCGLNVLQSQTIKIKFYNYARSGGALDEFYIQVQKHFTIGDLKDKFRDVIQVDGKKLIRLQTTMNDDTLLTDALQVSRTMEILINPSRTSSDYCFRNGGT